MTDNTNFLGIPVVGDITRGERKANQRPLEEFAPVLQAVLDDPTIVELGWTQYTPYFNDGDPCVFSADGVWVRTDQDTDVESTYDLQPTRYSGHPSLGKRDYRWEGQHPNRYRVDLNYEGPDEARFDRCRALEDAIDSGEFDDVLLDAFGDHAEITVRRDGIQVEFYEHE